MATTNYSTHRRPEPTVRPVRFHYFDRPSSNVAARERRKAKAKNLKTRTFLKYALPIQSEKRQNVKNLNRQLRLIAQNGLEVKWVIIITFSQFQQ